MEALQSLYDLMSLVFVLSTIVSMGLSLTVTEILEPLRSIRFVVAALVVNFLLVPGLAYGVTELIPLEESLVIGLMLVALAAGAPGLPKTAAIARVDTAAATGTMVLLIVATIVVMPLALPVLLEGVEVGFWDIASGLVVLMFIPLAASLFVRARWAAIADAAEPHVTQASTFSLVALMVLMLVLNWQNVVDLFGSGGLIASAILVAGSAGLGFLLGGPDSSSRWVLSLGTGQRNIAAAMVVATVNFDDPNVLVVIIVFSLMTLLLIVPLAGELGRRAKRA